MTLTESRSHRPIAVLLAAVLLLAGLPGLSMGERAAAQEWSPPTTVYIERTGHTLDRLFLDMWREHGDLLGDPVTEEMEIATRLSDEDQTVQFFENAALVYLPDEVPGEQVRLLPVGRTMSVDARVDHQDAFAPVRATDCRDDDCQLVVRTRHTVEGETLAFWESEAGQLLGDPISQPFEDSDATVQYFENGALEIDRDEVTALPLGVAAAEADGHETGPIDRPADVPAYDLALFEAPEIVAEEAPVETATDAEIAAEVDAAPVGAAEEPVVEVVGPGPQQGGTKEIVISISASSFWAYDNGELFLSSLVSTGVGAIPETVTPIGYFSILTKVDMQDMQGVLGGEDYFVADVPWVMYFDDLGNALHGAYWHNNFGTPMSHGCVNLPMDIAPVLYAWAEIGTPVTVIP